MDKKPSETSCIREEALKYCIGNGLDIGYGWDKIKRSAISVDINIFSGGRFQAYNPNLECDFDELNYYGDARNLPFKNSTMDYVYSSHCLEDFADTKPVLLEWLRVLKSGGFLILYLPIQKMYADYCTLHGTTPNSAHKVDMSPNYILNCISGMNVKVEQLIEKHRVYSFFIVLRKL